MSDDELWLRERGWVPDRNAWRLMVGRRVCIYTFGEACKFQRRSDRAKGLKSEPICRMCNLGRWRPAHQPGHVGGHAFESARPESPLKEVPPCKD